jgi:hypothetical protein
MGDIKKTVAQKFDYDISALADYVDQQSEMINVKQVTEAKSMEYMRLQTGIKHKEIIKLLDDQISLQDATCKMTASGDTVFTDREIEVASIGWMKEFCNNDLVGFWTQLALRAGAASENEEMVFEEAIVSLLMDKQALINENLIWQGDKLSADANLNKIDGFIKILTVANSCVELNTTSSPQIDSTNAYSIMRDSVYANTPKNIKRNPSFVAFVGCEVFEHLKANLVDLNLFHYNPETLSNGMDSIILPGTSMRVVSVPGLDNSDNVYTGISTDFVVGTDLESDFDEFKIWYSMDDDILKMRCKYRIGVQVPFPDQVGVYIPV